MGEKNRQPSPITDKETGKKVAIVGAGPAGLAASSLLSRYGHKVTIFESSDMAGGTAWYGVPDYHLPKNILIDEIEKIKSLGVDIRTKITIGKDITLSQILEEYDSVLITTGSKDAVELDIPGASLKGVISGYEFLETVFAGGLDNYLKKPKYDLGNDILVIGGGDTSLDCARTALRLSNGNVTVLCLHPKTELHVDPIMFDEAEEEGVKFRFEVQAKSFQGDKGNITDATINSVRISASDDMGKKI